MLILQQSILQSVVHIRIFDRGYLTVIKEQAEKMAARVSRIHGGEPVINVYEFDESVLAASELKIKDFGDITSPDRARFVKK